MAIINSELDACRCQPIPTWKAHSGSYVIHHTFPRARSTWPDVCSISSFVGCHHFIIISFISLISFFSFPQLSPSSVSVSSGTTCITSGSQTVKLSSYGVDQNLVVDLDLGHRNRPQWPVAQLTVINSMAISGTDWLEVPIPYNPIYKAYF